MDLNGGEKLTRTNEEISTILAHAKLNKEDFLPTTQVLYINGDKSKSDQYKILELDNHLLETLKCGEVLTFKGRENDSAVLCTDSRTYEVRECETSNSLLLIPELQFSSDLKEIKELDIKEKHVAGINYKYLEVILSKPRLNTIIKMLENTKYKGPEQEFEHENVHLMDYVEFANIVQASQKELKQILDKLDVIILNGKIRLLDLDYHFRVLSYLLKCIDENSWKIDEIRKIESINSWTEIVPKEVLEAIFNIYTEESKTIDDTLLYKYNEIRVCQFFAKVLLQYAGKFNLNDFLQAWKDSVPEGMMANEEMLNGIAIIDRNAEPNVIWAFPENNLPDSIVERFEILFRTKPKWTITEITPYIENLTTEKNNASALLAKFARASTVNGVRYYSSKYDN